MAIIVPALEFKLISSRVWEDNFMVEFSCHAHNYYALTKQSRALAQKVSIRLSSRYPHSKLLEINAHSLFSKWFSESSKLVGKMFDEILAMLDDEDTFVLVLIGE